MRISESRDVTWTCPRPGDCPDAEAKTILQTLSAISQPPQNPIKKNVEYIEKVSPQTFRQNKGNLYNEKCHSIDTTKYQGSLFLGLIFNLWLQIICHYLENKRSHYLHSSLQPQSYTLFSYKIRVGRGLRRYTEEKSKREQTLLQAYRPSHREGYISG